MGKVISRRRFIGTAMAAATWSTGIWAADEQQAPPRTAAPPSAPRRLVAQTRTLEVNGRPAKVFGLIGPDGRRGIRLSPGERFDVDLVNETGESTIIHWHGQLPPWTQDGFPWPQTPPFPNGTTRTYDYMPIAGTHWMHSHHDLQEQLLLSAPLIVEDEATRRDDRQDVVLMLNDFTFRSPEEVLANLKAPEKKVEKQTASSPGGQPTRADTKDTATQDGPAGGIMLNDVNYDAFLANDRTLDDPEIVHVERNGAVRLRIINGAASSQFWIDLGALNGRLVAADGHPVVPLTERRFQIATAQRLDILIDLPTVGAFPVFAQLEGSRRRTGIILATTGGQVAKTTSESAPIGALDNSMETRLTAAQPLPVRQPDAVHTIPLGGQDSPYAWSMNGEYWPQSTPIMLTNGQRIEIELINQTMMSHPIHLHGHAFQVIGINGQAVNGAVRDTIMVSPMNGRVRIAFDAVNPGRWAFHCHNLYHLDTGMAMELRYRGITV